MPGEMFFTMQTVLLWSVVLLMVHIVAQAGTSTFERGTSYNMGTRDDPKSPTGVLAGRADRALRNFLETYPAFIVLAFLLIFVPMAGSIHNNRQLFWAQTGAWVWFWARVAYLPAYLFGVPILRTLIWVISAIGLGLMAALLF